MGAASANVAKGPASAGYAPPAALLAERAGGDGYMPPLASLAAIPARPAVQRAGEEREESPVQPRLEVGPVGDRFEQEADAIAAQVMAAREGGTTEAAPAASVQRACGACSASVDEPRARRTSLIGEEISEAAPAVMRTTLIGEEISEAPPMIQRECAACATSEDSRRARRTSLIGAEIGRASPDDARLARGRRTAGAETIAASDSQLTRGGSPLSSGTRTFFESRMGRDLGDVRIHQGDSARALNRSISARAFTYRDHIWLGAGESAGPSFTMAHELAHVMQQTAPGPIGPIRRQAEAHEKEPAVQRKPAPFWLPSGVGTGAMAKGQHQAIHNAAQKRLREDHGELLTEVPIPGANRKVMSTGKCGFADLYTADPVGNEIPVPGVEAVTVKAPAAKAAAAPPAAPPATPPAGALPVGAQPAAPTAASYRINNFTKDSSRASCATFIGADMKRHKAPAIHEDLRAPKLSKKGKLLKMDKAPANIKVGEVKPVHNLGYRGDGAVQVANYLGGLTTTINETNKVAAAAGLGTWNGNPTRLDLGSNLPQGWSHDGTGAGAWPVNSCKIRGYDMVSKTYRGGKKKGQTYIGPQAKDVKQGRPVSDPIRGRWIFAADDLHAGVYVYSLVPNPDDLKTALSRHSTSAEFRGLSADIAAIQKPLITPPPVKKVVMPLRLASAASPRVRREVKDEFSAREWDARRVGDKALPKLSENNLRDRYDNQVSNEMREEIPESAAMVDWLKSSPDTAGTVYPDAAAFAGITADSKLLKKLAFWTSWKAGPFGFLREKFGKGFAWAYNKAIEYREKIKQRFHEKKEGDYLGGRTSTLYKAMAKVAAVVVPRVAIPFIRSMFNTIVDCGAEGFKTKVHELIEGTPIEDVMNTADEIRAKAKTIGNNIESYFTKMVDETFGPIKQQFDAFIAETKLLMEVAGIVQEIAKGMRVGACIAGLISAPETVGIGAVVGCGAAVADYILGKFGLSPVEYIVAMTLQSCKSQNLIGRGIAGMAFLKSLSQEAGKAIVTQVKKILAKVPGGPFAGKTFGQHASELFCNPETMTFPALDYKDVDCRGTPAFKGSVTGDYTIPDDIKRFQEGDPLGPEKKWMGRDGSEGVTGGDAATPPPEKPATPAGGGAQPGATPGGGGKAGGTTGTGGKSRQHSVEDGTVTKGKMVTVRWYVYDGFDYGKFDPPLRRLEPVGAQDSDGTIFGPDSIVILIHEVFLDGSQPKIRFSPIKDYRFVSDGAKIGLKIGVVRTGFVHGPMKKAKPDAGGEK